MIKLKSHKTVEQIAKKHRLNISFIQKQLDIGEPIEHEHTKDHNLARDIALQHLDEIPDYYTRLKKMETDAKKNNKKFKDIKDVSEGIIDRLRGRKQIGTTGSGGRVYISTKQKPSTVTYGGTSSREIEQKRVDAKRKEKVDKGQYNDPWLKTASGGERRVQLQQLRSEETKSGDEGLRDWFGKSKSSTGKKGWVQLGGKWAGEPCARQPGQTSTPKCGSSKMAANMSDEEEEAARRRKNRLDPNQPEKTGAAKPTNVKTEEMNLQEVKDKPGKGSGKKDACYHKVKSRYDVWPSAYASGALVKCRKVGAANWGTKSEEMNMHEEERYCPLCDKRETRSQCSYGEKAWDKVSIKDEEYSMARSELKTKINEATRLQAQTGNVIAATLSWRGKYYTIKMFFPQAKFPTRKEMNNELQKVYPGSIIVYHSVSEIQSGQPLIQTFGPQGGSSPKLGPNKNYVKSMGEEVEIEEDWQKVNRQDKTNGLSQKAVDAYRRENPGSKLQTAVTEKNPTGKRADRRASFCRRMKGMKSKLTSAKTARDPDSNINKALRRWNCN